MSTFTHLQEATLMVVPSRTERKETAEICIYLKKDFELNKGDEIRQGVNKESDAIWSIVEVIEHRDAKLSGYYFIRALADYSIRKIS